jgi:hypothetical protein
MNDSRVTKRQKNLTGRRMRKMNRYNYKRPRISYERQKKNGSVNGEREETRERNKRETITRGWKNGNEPRDNELKSTPRAQNAFPITGFGYPALLELPPLFLYTIPVPILGRPIPLGAPLPGPLEGVDAYTEGLWSPAGADSLGLAAVDALEDDRDGVKTGVGIEGRRSPLD